MLSKVIIEDVSSIIEEGKHDNALNGTSFLITGATGHIAKYFCYLLLEYNRQKDANIDIYALVRNKDKAESVFAEYLDDSRFNLVVQDICDEISLDKDVDYIFHAAGSASAQAIKSNPTGIIRANTVGSIKVLEYAKDHKVKKVLFPSTREVYGKVEGLDYIAESDMGTMDPLNSRNCYPESKRMAEAILKSYNVQYGIDFNIARIAHTYGPGMTIVNDGRVMADFIGAAVKGRDIVLNSDGTAIRAFCYVTDTIKGLLDILFYGDSGEAYNLANETEPKMIRDVAAMIVSASGNSNLKVEYKAADEETKKGYLGYKITQLDTDKLEELGWKPIISLNDGIKRTLEYYNEENDK